MDDQQRDVARFYLAALFGVLTIAFGGCQRTVVTAAPSTPEVERRDIQSRRCADPVCQLFVRAIIRATRLPSAC